MTSPAPPPITAAAVVAPHAGSGPLTVLQLNCARVRIATEMLTQVVQALESCPASVRQRACAALSAVVELHAALKAQP